MKKMTALLAMLQISLLGAGLSAESNDTDIHTDCLSAAEETDGAFYFDGDFCRCTVSNSVIDPTSRDSIWHRCVEVTKVKKLCESAGSQVARFVAPDSAFGASGSCLCATTGTYLDSYDVASLTPNLELCKSRQGETNQMSSYEISAQLSHYLHGLPKNVVPLVDLKSLKSIYSFLNPMNSGRTVKIVGKKTGIHGGTVYAYRLKWNETSWIDFSDPVGQQSDPRLGVQLLGHIIGPFFGFQKIDENTYTVPSLDEYQRALASINKDAKLIQGSAFEALGQFDQSDYVEKFENEGALPASEFLPDGDQTYFFHDVTHLAAIIVFASDLYLGLQSMAKLTRVIQQKVVATILKPAIIKELEKESVDYRAIGIDALSTSPLITVLYPSDEDAYSVLEPLLLQPKELALCTMGNTRSSVLTTEQLKEIDSARSAYLAGLEDDLVKTSLAQKFLAAGINTTSTMDRVNFLMKEHRAKLVERLSLLLAQCFPQDS